MSFLSRTFLLPFFSRRQLADIEQMTEAQQEANDKMKQNKQDMDAPTVQFEEVENKKTGRRRIQFAKGGARGRGGIRGRGRRFGSGGRAYNARGQFTGSRCSLGAGQCLCHLRAYPLCG